jgi:hypothetical protein
MSRFTFDTHTVPLALDRLTREYDAEAFGDLLERLMLIYDEANPPTPVG